MKKLLLVIMCITLCTVFMAACSSPAQPAPEPPVVSDPAPETEQEQELETETEPETETEDEPDNDEGDTENVPERRPAPSGDVIDALLFDTEENAAPLGQWVALELYNAVSREHEIAHIRFTRIIRDQTEVQRIIDGYTGNWDLSLDEQQARDIEWAVIEYEIHYPDDWTGADWGFTASSPSFNATPIGDTSFRLGNTAYIGVGSGLCLGNMPSDLQPGDTVTLQAIFTVLIAYDDSEYVLMHRWYEGEIEVENARELYFSAR
jgi:hypothetical protein